MLLKLVKGSLFGLRDVHRWNLRGLRIQPALSSVLILLQHIQRCLNLLSEVLGVLRHRSQGCDLLDEVLLVLGSEGLRAGFRAPLTLGLQLAIRLQLIGCLQ